MNNEDKFITEIEKAKIFSFPFTKETFRKQFLKRDNLLETIIAQSVLKNIDCIPVFSDILTQSIENNFNINDKSIRDLCVKFNNLNKQKIMNLDDIFISKLCSLKLNHNQCNLDHIKAQIQICKQIKNFETKIDTSKIIYVNALAIENNSKTQKMILEDWKKLKQNIADIADLVPLFNDKKPAIFSSLKPINVIEINCNTLADTFSTKPVHSFKACQNILNQFQNKFPESIIFSDEKNERKEFTIFLKDINYSQNLTICLEYFMYKINEKKSWSNSNEINEIIDTNWNSLLLSNKLNQELEEKKRNLRLKI